MKKLCTALLLSLFAISFAHANETKQIVLKVKEMNCQLCAYLVNKELRNIDGVISTKASIKDGLVTVVEDPKVTNQQLFDAIGATSAIAEKDFPTFSALAGSSPAYIYFFIDAMARAGVKHGLSKDAATKIAAQATLGSAQNVLASDKIPFDQIDQVSSPGGTTVAGLLAMEEAGFMTAVVKGIDATIAKELGES